MNNNEIIPSITIINLEILKNRKYTELKNKYREQFNKHKLKIKYHYTKEMNNFIDENRDFLSNLLEINNTVKDNKSKNDLIKKILNDNIDIASTTKFIIFYYWLTDLSLFNLATILNVKEQGVYPKIANIVKHQLVVYIPCPECGELIKLSYSSGRTDKYGGKRDICLCKKCQEQENILRKEQEIKQAQKTNKLNKNDIKEENLNKLKHIPYTEYLKTEHWKGVRKKALYKAHYKCEVCNSTEELNVHHKTYEHRGEEPPEDLIVLCHHCHAKFHDKLDENDKINDNNIKNSEDTLLLNQILNILHIDKDEIQQYIIHKNKINQFEQKVQNNFINNDSMSSIGI
jgi:5-methylcytosine-specific restriction endonuclease McrA